MNSEKFHTTSEPIEGHVHVGALAEIESIITDQAIAKQQYEFLITTNKYLPKKYKSVSLEQFIIIITKMRDGLLEATKCSVDGKLMGEAAIPPNIAWVSGLIQGEYSSKISYQKDEDRVLVTARCIAELADASTKGRGYHYDKLGGAIVRAEDLALLLMAEEASHRYDVKVRGLEFGDSSKNRQHPSEKSAELVIKQIVDRLSIPTFK